MKINQVAYLQSEIANAYMRQYNLCVQYLVTRSCRVQTRLAIVLCINDFVFGQVVVQIAEMQLKISQTVQNHMPRKKHYKTAYLCCARF
jgi:hypothetical protein